MNGRPDDEAARLDWPERERAKEPSSGVGRILVRIVVVGLAFVAGMWVGARLEKTALEQGSEYDANWDGKVDGRYEYELDGSSRYVSDSNFDGKFDGLLRFDRYGIVTFSSVDSNFDGTHDYEYEYVHGVPTKGRGYVDRERPPVIETDFEHGIRVRERVDRDGDGVLDTLYGFDHLGRIVSEEPLEPE